MIKTYWGKTDFGEKNLGPPWELEFSEDRGYFAIAMRDFEAGELICKEKPTTFTAGWHPFSDEQVKTLNEDVAQLSEEEQKAFFEMSNMFPECDPAAGIYMTNSFDMASEESSAGGCGMYLAIARLNHSCCPNAQQTHIPDTKEEVMGATPSLLLLCVGVLLYTSIYTYNVICATTLPFSSITTNNSFICLFV